MILLFDTVPKIGMTTLATKGIEAETEEPKPKSRKTEAHSEFLARFFDPVTFGNRCRRRCTSRRWRNPKKFMANEN